MAKCKWVDKDGNIDVDSKKAKQMVSAYLHNLTVIEKTIYSDYEMRNDNFRDDILEAVSKMLFDETI